MNDSDVWERLHFCTSPEQWNYLLIRNITYTLLKNDTTRLSILAIIFGDRDIFRKCSNILIFINAFLGTHVEKITS